MSADAWRIKVVQRLPSIHSYKILNTGIVMFLNYHNNHIDIYIIWLFNIAMENHIF